MHGKPIDPLAVLVAATGRAHTEGEVDGHFTHRLSLGHRQALTANTWIGKQSHALVAVHLNDRETPQPMGGLIYLSLFPFIQRVGAWEFCLLELHTHVVRDETFLSSE